MTVIPSSVIGYRNRCSMEEKKVRVIIRPHKQIRACLEQEATYEGLRVATLANSILQEELQKIDSVGLENCVMQDSEKYKMLVRENKVRDSYYIIPSRLMINSYVPLISPNAKESTKQVSFFVYPEQLEILKAVTMLIKAKGSIKNGKISSYRFAVAALLLNNPVCKELYESPNN